MKKGSPKVYTTPLFPADISDENCLLAYDLEMWWIPILQQNDFPLFQKNHFRMWTFYT